MTAFELAQSGYPSDRRYSPDHVWAKLSGSTLEIGMTPYALEALGQLQSLRFAALGSRVEQDSPCGEIEANKSVSDVYAPVAGVLVDVNQATLEMVELITDDPFARGWLARLDVSDSVQQFGQLLDVSGYLTLIDEGSPRADVEIRQEMDQELGQEMGQEMGQEVKTP